MDPTDLIVISTVVVTGSTLIRDVKQGKGGLAGPIIFGFMMAAGLLLISIPLPRVAKGLAYLSLVGAFVVNGPSVFSVATGLTTKAKTTTPADGGNTLPPSTTQRVTTP